MTTIPPDPEEALVTISAPKSDTVRVRDRVESSRFEFYFDDDVEIVETPTDELYFPVDVAVELRGDWSTIQVPMATGVFVHDHKSGMVQNQVGSETPEITLETGEYELEFVPAPVKVYLRTHCAVRVKLDEGRIQLNTSEAGYVTVGVRSTHEHPAGTITTTESVEDVMAAISNLGSALKTTSPERSWPTLRGQPPNVTLGDKLDIPKPVRRHDVDVTIEIPRDIRTLFNVAPLTYYTSAEVVPLGGDESQPAIVAAGERIPLAGTHLGQAAAAQLKRNVLLDCVVRSVGIYPFATIEQEAIEGELHQDLDTIYEMPIGERIKAYQEVPESIINDVWPMWPLTIDVSGSFDDIPAIPHLAEELAVVRVPKTDIELLDPQPNFVSDFIRADGSGGSSVERTESESDQLHDISQPMEWNTQLHTSLQEGYPLGSNKTSIRAYEEHLERGAPNTDAIKVKVICNEDGMREEDIVTELYGLRDLLEFNITIHYNLTVDRFSDLLSESFDLVHYIGHVDDSGFKCQDGYLDVRTDIDEVNFDVFILNACRSVEQGEALLEAGADGGIATLFDVPNSSATKLGRTLSRLLNRGFTIRSALEIARESSYLGNRWVSLGNGRVSLTQPESGVTFLPKITPKDDAYELELESYETATHRIGTIVDLNTEWARPCVLPGLLQETLSEEQAEELFSLEALPILYNNELFWTDEVSPSELREHQN